MKPTLPTSDELLAELVALPGPPGQEDSVRDYLAGRLTALGIAHRVDARGNLLASPGDSLPEAPTSVVTAHMDEIALMVTGADYLSLPGALRVAPLGGVHPWKWGEGAVEVLPLDGGDPVPAILGFGSIHTTSPLSAAQSARDGRALTWDDARVVTGLNGPKLLQRGIVPGCRVVMARDRRRVIPFGEDLVASYFLDDRADCVAWLLALAALRGSDAGRDVLFAATVSEEVGGEGAQYLLHALPAPPEMCIALEIGPSTPDNRLLIDATPTVWVSDTFAAMAPRDLALVYQAGSDAGLSGVQPQVVTRGGSDATIAATNGLCARHATLAFAADNSHGFEIMHKDAPQALARLLVAYLRCLS